MKTKNKKPALATRAGRNARGQANVSARYSTSRFFLRQLAARATQNARRCERETAKRKFERLARFLEVCARGGVR
ncbi:MAG: hypothetical protein B6D41_11820 [Chloroflexi bacterium UTCFX4]|jgi:hypothetical protein|nr:MAG: hypothetical protein B6D41_11820 [Chloroflexi bacterium UTCFX4]